MALSPCLDFRRGFGRRKRCTCLVQHRRVELQGSFVDPCIRTPKGGNILEKDAPDFSAYLRTLVPKL